MKKVFAGPSLLALGLAAMPLFAASDVQGKPYGENVSEIAARLKPLRIWALPYAAGVPYESYVSRKKAPKGLDKLDPEKVRKAAQPWTRLSADEFFPYIDKYGQFLHGCDSKPLSR